MRLLALLILSFWIFSCGEDAEEEAVQTISVLTTMHSINHNTLLLQESQETLRSLWSKTARSSAVSNLDFTSDVSITSMKIPLHRIYVQNDSGDSQEAFTCTGECLVELVDDDLGDILTTIATNSPNSDPDQTKELPPLVFNRVYLNHCNDQSGPGNFSGTITAEADIGDETYYTKSDGTISTSGPAEEMSMELGPCQNTMNLGTDISIVQTGESEEAGLRFYFDTRASLYFAANQNSAVDDLPGECSNDSGQNVVCASQIGLVAAYSQTPPAIERYVVNDSFIFGLYFDGDSGDFIGGYNRPYYDENTTQSTSWAGFIIEDFAQNESAYTLQVDGGQKFSASDFQRVDEDASFTGTATILGEQTSYTATRLD